MRLCVDFHAGSVCNIKKSPENVFEQTANFTLMRVTARMIQDIQKESAIIDSQGILNYGTMVSKNIATRPDKLETCSLVF